MLVIQIVMNCLHPPRSSLEIQSRICFSSTYDRHRQIHQRTYGYLPHPTIIGYWHAIVRTDEEFRPVVKLTSFIPSIPSSFDWTSNGSQTPWCESFLTTFLGFLLHPHDPEMSWVWKVLLLLGSSQDWNTCTMHGTSKGRMLKAFLCPEIRYLTHLSCSIVFFHLLADLKQGFFHSRMTVCWNIKQ